MKDISIYEKLHTQFYKCNKLLKRNIFEQKMEHIKAVPYRGQGRILRLLLEEGEMTQKDIVIEMDIRPSTAWELVDKLERANFIEKTPNPDDKRGTIIRLTEAGKEEAMSSKWDKSKISKELFSALDEEELKALSALLDKLITSLKDSENDRDEGFEFDFNDDAGKSNDNTTNDNVEHIEKVEEVEQSETEEKNTSQKDEEARTRSSRGHKSFKERMRDDLNGTKKFFKNLFKDVGSKKEKSVKYDIVTPEKDNENAKAKENTDASENTNDTNTNQN